MSGFSRLGAWWYGRFNRDPASNRLVVALAELTPQDHALEIGCGPGAALAAAAAEVDATRLAAVDPTPGFVERAARRVPGVDVRLGTAEALPFPSGTFTVAWSVAAMHHWSDRDKGLAELVRVLAPGGRLLLLERHLRRSGHGITDAQAAEVMSRLRELGVAAVAAEAHRAGREKFLVVTGTA